MKIVNGIARYDLLDEEDMAVLIKTGLLWKGGPKAYRAGLKYLKAHPDEVNDMVPPEVMAVLKPEPNQVTPPGAPTPVEPPVADEVSNAQPA